MKKLLLILGFIFLLTSCSREEIISSTTCVGGDCNAEFVINPLSQPNSYLDERGYWHIFHEGINYFTIDGFLNDVNEEYKINGVSIIETGYDSDYWVWINNFQFTVPLYSFLGYFTGGGFNNPIPVGNVTYTIEDMAGVHPPLNIVGYQITKNMCLDCPYSPTLLGTYSKYTNRPKQNVFYDDEMVGDTINVFIKTKWAGEWDDAKVIKNYQLKIILDE
tara:strand:- start:14771 stop:15427 length:657 start_codon:yes stop_codon:yes gene_type:complete